MFQLTIMMRQSPQVMQFSFKDFISANAVVQQIDKAVSEGEEWLAPFKDDGGRTCKRLLTEEIASVVLLDFDAVIKDTIAMQKQQQRLQIAAGAGQSIAVPASGLRQ